jgi:hypothetical protein
VGFNLQGKLEEERARVERSIGGELWKKGRKNGIKKENKEKFWGDGGYCQEEHIDGWIVKQEESDSAILR